MQPNRWVQSQAILGLHRGKLVGHEPVATDPQLHPHRRDRQHCRRGPHPWHQCHRSRAEHQPAGGAPGRTAAEPQHAPAGAQRGRGAVPGAGAPHRGRPGACAGDGHLRRHRTGRAAAHRQQQCVRPPCAGAVAAFAAAALPATAAGAAPDRPRRAAWPGSGGCQHPHRGPAGGRGGRAAAGACSVRVLRLAGLPEGPWHAAGTR